jgi:RNA polymerase sigma-70 factor (ECF subfamily)
VWYGAANSNAYAITGLRNSTFLSKPRDGGIIDAAILEDSEGRSFLSLSEKPDRELIEACLNKDPAAWEALLHRYKRLIYGVTVRFGFDAEDRHEIFQTICLEILRSVHALREVDKVRSWILTITIRECNDCIRRKIRERKVFAAGNVPQAEPIVDTLGVYAAVERAEMLREAIQALSEHCRELLRLLFLQEEKASYELVAERLGISKDSIGSARQRCLERLRKTIETHSGRP